MEIRSSAPDANNQVNVQINLLKIYVKSSHFDFLNSLKEIPSGTLPALEQQWQVHVFKVEEHVFEVVLELKLTAQFQDKSFWKLKLQEAGVYRIECEQESQAHYVLNTLCANHLYGYACAQATLMVTQSGLPGVFFMPMNFEQIYQQEMEKQNETQNKLKQTELNVAH